MQRNLSLHGVLVMSGLVAGQEWRLSNLSFPLPCMLRIFVSSVELLHICQCRGPGYPNQIDPNC